MKGDNPSDVVCRICVAILVLITMFITGRLLLWMIDQVDQAPPARQRPGQQLPYQPPNRLREPLNPDEQPEI